MSEVVLDSLACEVTSIARKFEVLSNGEKSRSARVFYITIQNLHGLRTENPDNKSLKIPFGTQPCSHMLR